VYLAFHSSPGGPVAAWSASAPNASQISSAKDTSTDLTTASDGTLFALRSNAITEIRGTDLSLIATPTSYELENIPHRVSVPDLTLHPSGALLYEPFLDGPAPAAAPAGGLNGGIDICNVHNGKLHLRIYLPEPLAMLSTDIDGLRGNFLTTEKNGQRLFALTTSGLTIVQLANVPLGIGTLAPNSGAAEGGTMVTIGHQTYPGRNVGGRNFQGYEYPQHDYTDSFPLAGSDTSSLTPMAKRCRWMLLSTANNFSSKWNFFRLPIIKIGLFVRCAH
jgi:hypothetical protein